MPDTNFADAAVIDSYVTTWRDIPLPDPGCLLQGRLPVPRHSRSDDAGPPAETLAVDLSGTTPTLLPDLLRAIARRARHLAGDPYHPLDDNPFIMREWLIVSQVLHAAASTMERRFEALFFGQ